MHQIWKSFRALYFASLMMLIGSGLLSTYLALRLAYIQDHAAQAGPLPVIMDEVLVNFDPQRAERTARAFVELTGGGQGKAHQLLYFTCQPHMAEMLRKAEPQAALFH